MGKIYLGAIFFCVQVGLMPPLLNFILHRAFLPVKPLQTCDGEGQKKKPCWAAGLLSHPEEAKSQGLSFPRL